VLGVELVSKLLHLLGRTAEVLVRVLPDYEFEPTAIFSVYPSSRQLSTKVRAVVDLLAAELQDPPLWDRQLAGTVAGFPAQSP
jgi:DNA-binding transcriptional LysR family regulator